MIHQVDTLTSEDINQLTNGLLESVIDGASLGFLDSVDYWDIHSYWLEVASSLNKSCILLVAEQDGLIVGTVQLSLSMKDNGKHRGEVQKLFVLPEHQGKGVAAKLMQSIETLAVKQNVTLIVLDTESGSKAERFYQFIGYTKVGEIPSFALTPLGEMSATSIYYKLLKETLGK